MKKPLFIDWCAKEALDGMLLLDPWDELAYRRILDLIYTTNDSLPDDDKKLAWMTKTGARWKRIKQNLLAMEKIEIIDGRISHQKCREKLQKAARLIAQKVLAGEASAATRKPLRTNETTPTGVATAVVTAEPTSAPTNQEPRTKNQKKKEDPFDEWWPFVPLKKSKGAARKAFTNALEKTDFETLKAGISRYAWFVQSEGHDPKFTKHPSTWLNQECWEDDYGIGGEKTPEQAERDEVATALNTAKVRASKARQSVKRMEGKSWFSDEERGAAQAEMAEAQKQLTATQEKEPA